MTSYQQEQLENIRRAAERGKRVILPAAYNSTGASSALDCLQHILDLVESIKRSQ